jgi:hypothetical protein
VMFGVCDCVELPTSCSDIKWYEMPAKEAQKGVMVYLWW